MLILIVDFSINLNKKVILLIRKIIKQMEIIARKIITEIFKDSKVQRRKGCHMTKQIRAYGEGLILEWLMEEYEPGHPNLERIYSEPLLEELI